MTHKVYVYGTLRPGGTPTVQIPAMMFDIGWFPGAVLKDEEDLCSITCEVIEVDDAGLAHLDRYEGYYPSDPENSLYIRREYNDGFIYEYNRPTQGRVRIGSGDWWAYEVSKGRKKKEAA